MKKMLRVVAVLIAAGVPRQAPAQSFETLGTRAAGMSGAFVAVADDASAVYWNPAGLAAGAYFSLALDRTSGETVPGDLPTAGNRSSFFLGMSMPAFGVSYYRLRNTAIEPIAEPAADRNTAGAGPVRVQNLVTHHTGLTLVQSIFPGLAVGGTVKFVRGIAAAGGGAGANVDDLLDDAPDIVGRATNNFDADIGVMATAGRLKAGVTVRNITEPEFDTPGGTELKLERQARVGVAVSPTNGWAVSADFDVLKTTGVHGRMRDFALGVEGRLGKRVFVRSGTRANTIDDGFGHMPSASFGGSYSVTASILVDAQVTVGSDRAPTGWGVAGRFVY